MSVLGVKQRFSAGLGRRMAKFMSRKLVTVRPHPPIVSFTFDDFPQSALYIAGRMLHERNLAGTYYASLGLMGQTAPTGKIFEDADLDHLAAHGHELGCHTFDHTPAWETEPAVYLASATRNLSALQGRLPAMRIRSHSYPVSVPRVATKRGLGRLFGSIRAGGQTHNETVLDLNYLNAFFIERSLTNFKAILRAIEANAHAGGWLIFATHDVSPSPTAYGCRPEQFEQILDWTLQSGASVVTVSGALERMGLLFST